jgi:hypothetical protein
VEGDGARGACTVSQGGKFVPTGEKEASGARRVLIGQWRFTVIILKFGYCTS